MNKRQKELFQYQLTGEKKVLRELERVYSEALADINTKLELLIARQDADMQHVIYQAEHQKALKTQVQSILENLQTKEFDTLSKYLTDSYEDGFIGSMYDMHGQGVPLILPINQKQVVAAILHETKLSENLYTHLGKSTTELKKKIANEISRGISSGLDYPEIARNIRMRAKIPLNNAMTIARTESHRIQIKGTADAQHKAKKMGADVVKQWDASLDGDTRKSHRKLDGQIRELDEDFEVDGKRIKYPGGFGKPEEDCNCRCGLLQRARWALDESELDTLKERAEYFGLDKTKDFEDFKQKYLKALETQESLENTGKSGIIKSGKNSKMNIQFFAEMPKEKFTQYSLNPEKEPDKAKAFKEALGYDLDNYEDLMKNIEEHVDESKFVEKGDNGYGMRYEYIMNLTGANNKKANVLTAWIQDGEDKRLTSVYVTERKPTDEN